MGKITAIALNTFRESIRDKIFYSLLAFAVLMLGFSMILGNLTIGDPVKIVKDFGLGAISLFGTLIAIFVGIGLVYKEMDKRTIYVILSKPIARWQFLLGKYFGLSLTLMIEVVIMTIGLFLLCYFYVPDIPWSLFKAIIPICFELQLILAVALLFSSFSSPFLSGLFTLAVFIIGHTSADIKALADKTEDIFLQMICKNLYYALPNLENLNFKARVVHNLPLDFSEIGFSLVYAVVYTVMIILLSVIIFQNRDMK
ncbi:putative ABC transporter, permease protein [Desulfonema limicola]|uniref:ABC transporter, permease protein n=1 Tax=Desulfonema limicola TaxID=45656 RepID=A0A975BAS7_9BACT|nr:ABC transporter permease [Desulfonema limicola]QTA81907.1 putative ABC transporter, permease protein [Desulfonema limicola]